MQVLPAPHERPIRLRPRDGQPRALIECAAQWLWRWRLELMLLFIAVGVTVGLISQVGNHP